MLARRFPERPLETLDREFGKVLNRMWNAAAEIPGSLAPYAVDVHEDADHFYVTAELPGFTKEDVEITLEEGVLMIKAEKKSETDAPKADDNGKQPLHVERRWSRFERAFTLPTAVKEDSVNANLVDGVLTITLDKREEVKPRRIPINGGPVKAGNGSKQ